MSEEDLVAGDGQDLDELHNGEREAGALHLIVTWDPKSVRPAQSLAGAMALMDKDPAAEERLLRVTVLAGRGLRAMDAMGANDVYVQGYPRSCEMAEEAEAEAAAAVPAGAQRTTVVEEGGSAPVWSEGEGEELLFWVGEMPEALELRCMDEDDDDDDEIGRVVIDLTATRKTVAWSKNDWVVLRQAGTRGAEPPPVRLKNRVLDVVVGGWVPLVIENAPAAMQ